MAINGNKSYLLAVTETVKSHNCTVMVTEISVVVETFG